MPSGSVLDREAWDAVAELCREHDLLLVVDTAMERILFDGREAIDPLALDGMKERTILVGSASKELRMIGWRVGWVVAPPALVDDIGLVGISNVVCQVGIAQTAVAVALEAGDDDVAAATAEWQRRRDVDPRRARRASGDPASRRLVDAARRSLARAHVPTRRRSGCFASAASPRRR